MSRQAGAAVLCVLFLTACSSGGSSAATTPTTGTAPTSATPTSAAPATTGQPSASAAPCSNPEGGSCLGPLPAGTYHTVVFTPQINYTLPKGWGNFEDTPGNFLLIPPGGDLAGVNPGTSDFIGVYSGVAAAATDCGDDGANALGVAPTPEAIAAHWAGLSAVTTTKPQPVSVGGLHGLVLDLTPNPAVAKAPCPDASSAYGYQPLIHGDGPASLDHGMIKGLHLRVYLLTTKAGSTLAIEIDDLHGGSKIAGYSKVATSMQFGA